MNGLDYWNKGITYLEYKEKIISLLSEGKVSGDVQNEDLQNYTRLNLHRMERVEKTFTPIHETRFLIENELPVTNWLVISEGWCGDAAQILPVLYKLSELSKGKIAMRIVFRDENKELIDQFLTNGGRSVPKLLGIQEGNLKFTWGPRPVVAQNLIQEIKTHTPANPKAYVEELHKWYAKDKGQEIQRELLELVSANFGIKIS